MDSPAAILSYWFGDGVTDRKSSNMESVEYIDERMGIWFAGKSKQFDQVQKDNADLVHRAGDGSLNEDTWLSPDGYLARVILLDQFTRCIYRGSSLAFQYDNQTALLVTHIINQGWLSEFTSIERFFLGVALQHSEDLANQQAGVDIARTVATGSPAAVVEYFANIKGYPHEHFEVIQQFGRFPSRNLALGRESTPEEVAWMASPDCPSWARSQLPPVLSSTTPSVTTNNTNEATVA